MELPRKNYSVAFDPTVRKWERLIESKNNSDLKYGIPCLPVDKQRVHTGDLRKEIEIYLCNKNNPPSKQALPNMRFCKIYKVQCSTATTICKHCEGRLHKNRASSKVSPSSHKDFDRIFESLTVLSRHKNLNSSVMR